MTGGPVIDILLATYNGERFLAAQLDSVIGQTYGDWRLLARDDGSTDGSVDMLRAFAGDHPGKIVLIEDGDKGLGASGNFERLMGHSKADYVMFCDQDDVWLPDKIDRLFQAMRELEARHGMDVPLLVHSDLRVVGSDCEETQSSFFAFQGIEPSFGRCINRLLVQNVVTGCASIFNRSLLARALPIPAEAAMHDWWLALVAASFGRIAFVREATVLYRQHGENAIGAKRVSFWAMLFNGFKSPAGAIFREKRGIARALRQARALHHQYEDQMPKAIQEIVTRFSAIPEQGFIARRITVARYRFLAKSLLTKLLFLTFV
jgi:glycosyltransferase involved in cell wall biosynthesis